MRRPRAPSGETYFLGQPESAVLRALATEPVAHAVKGSGGRSLAFKLTLADGTMGYFKPSQTFSASRWWSEVVSYYLDRALGLGRVPPTVSRRLPWAPLAQLAAGDRRLGEVLVEDDGTVRGALIGWVEGGLDPLLLGPGWERWIRIEGPLAHTPYRRPRAWARGNAGDDAGVDDGRGEHDDPELPPAQAPDRPDRPAELSDMIAFDYLTANVDRWGGGFTNVRYRRPANDRRLIFLDNSAGFPPGLGHVPVMEARLEALQRFRRSTVEAIRALDIDALRRRVDADPHGPLLDDRQWRGLGERRERLLEHVARLVERFGEDEVLAW